MQPYFLPYIGYFQMVKKADIFVFYDDVNYIKSGWINRNRILINKQPKYITIPLISPSSNKLINEIEYRKDAKELKTIYKSIDFNYRKAPYFDQVFELYKNIMGGEEKLISQLAMRSVRLISEYLQLDTEFIVSSESFAETKGLERTERLLTICESLKATQYINAANGRDLYSKEDFEQQGLQLNFIKSQEIKYKQFDNEFESGLSILDVLMFNSKEEVRNLLDKYHLS